MCVARIPEPSPTDNTYPQAPLSRVICSGGLRECKGVKEMKVINVAGKKIVLELSTMEAAIITEALREYGSDEAKKMVDTMMNRQELVIKGGE